VAGRIRQATFKFKPFSKKQLKVLTWWMPNSPVRDYDGIIADGSIRSGKTLSMSLSFVLWAMESFQGQNFAMCGKTIGSFRRNVLVLLKQMLRSRGYGISDHRADNLLIVTRKGVTNYFYIFGGKDERSQDLIQGITLAGCLFDEVALMPESFVNQATGRCSVDGSKFWFNCNPGSPQHWFKLNWIDKAAEKNLLYLHFTMEDNLALTEKIKARYRSMYSGVFYKRYIEGLWTVAEGLIYRLFVENEERYYIDHKDVPRLKYIEVGADVGGNKSNHAFVANGFDEDFRVMYVLKARSIKADGVSVSQFINEFVKFVDSVIKDYGFVDTCWPDCAEAAIVNELAAKTPYRIRGSIKGEIIDRIRCADILFSEGRIKLVRGETEDFAAGLRTAVWDPDKFEDTRLDDGTSDIDILDAWEYGYTPHMRRLLRSWKNENT